MDAVAATAHETGVIAAACVAAVVPGTFCHINPVALSTTVVLLTV